MLDPFGTFILLHTVTPSLDVACYILRSLDSVEPFHHDDLSVDIAVYVKIVYFKSSSMNESDTFAMLGS